jgi:hypothetical protein
VKVRRESQRSIVPWNPGNRPRRDPGEGRGRRTTESLGGNMAGASKPDSVFTKPQRIAELAKQSPQVAQLRALLRQRVRDGVPLPPAWVPPCVVNP